MPATKKQRELINSAAEIIRHELDNRTWTAYGTALIDMATKEERIHRRSWGARDYPASFSAAQAGRYFGVSPIVDFFCGKPTPSLKDSLHLRPSYVYAAKLWENYRDELNDALVGFDVAAFNELDYVNLVEVKQ
tara:strand:- start:558 stop:959 length:402 start_codon:yes stop_codon:yes gene_type:complete